MDKVEIHIIPSIYNLITVWISVAIVYFVFKKFFWSKMTVFLDKRKDYVMEQVDGAARSNVDAAESKRLANEELKQARIDSKSILDKSKNEAIRKKDEIIISAKNDASSQLEGARLEIEREKVLARKELEGEVVGIALGAAREVVKGSIDEKKSAELVDDFIKELKA